MISATHPIRQGFSLFEMLIVLSIIAIVSAIAGPRYANSLAGYRATNAARRLADDLNLVRTTARTTSTTLTINFDLARSTYSAAGVKDFNSASTTYTVRLNDDPYVATLEKVDFAGAPQLTFDRNGIPSNGTIPTGGTITLRVGDIRKTVVVDADSGKAGVQ